ncbi:polypyrimidine tract-binding protein homolog 1-like isoform X2 [Cornus florida]|uniref:polypyrimidine tract-binding protein homolog 1-like isoform X2 n=1 Tax=Cornus florida TaxID=4283 RepID=UPI0028988626|nr:polypyrimidine tract-binding protein homolog 1-like isoform X2 [Cornus florida]
MSPPGQPQNPKPPHKGKPLPSKVVYLTNLPSGYNEEDVLRFCKPYGCVLRAIVFSDGKDRKALVEFSTMAEATHMVRQSHPMRTGGRFGKTIYAQYSYKDEISEKRETNVSGNILNVRTVGVQSSDVNIDVLHMVFSACGFVRKIATYENSDGFQALIQFGDSASATKAKAQLNKASIPAYLLPKHSGTCHMWITQSTLRDLDIRFQTYRSRDYSDFYIPVVPTSIKKFVECFLDRNSKGHESNVLCAVIENLEYCYSLDILRDDLHRIFSEVGVVQKIMTTVCANGTQALIQYPDIPTASIAKDLLEGRCMYDASCKLRISYYDKTDIKMEAYIRGCRDYTRQWSIPSQPANAYGPPVWCQNPKGGRLTYGSEFAAAGAVEIKDAFVWNPTEQRGYVPPHVTATAEFYPTYALGHPH